MKTRNQQKNAGFTIIEIMAALAVTAVIASVGIPAMNNMLAKHRLLGAATQMQAQLQQLRSQAIKRDGSVFISFAVSGNTWRYGANANTSCDPAQANNCKINGVSTVYNGDDWSGVRVKLSKNFANNSLGFEPRRGMVIAVNDKVTSGTIVFQSSVGEIAVDVSPVGQVSLCSPSSGGIGGYAACS